MKLKKFPRPKDLPFHYKFVKTNEGDKYLVAEDVYKTRKINKNTVWAFVNSNGDIYYSDNE